VPVSERAVAGLATEPRESSLGAGSGDPRTTPVAAPSREPAQLGSMEQAALEEITSRASESEVICIIRPKDPGGKSEVITLDGVSPEFVRALAGQTASGKPSPATLAR